MPVNYISVSAISNSDQLGGIAGICHEVDFTLPLAIGYQVSNKSINQGSQNTRQPKFADLGYLDRLTRGYGFITAVHYYTKNNETIIGDLETIVRLGVTPSVTLLQLNTLPASLDVLSKIKEMGFTVIFKVAVSNKQSPQEGYAVWKGDKVEDVSTGQVEPLVGQVIDRRGVIDYAMFDPSHGTNLDLNLDEGCLAVKFGKSIIANSGLNHLGLVYAGGIKPSNVRPLIRSLLPFFPNRVSIDVESGVRTDDCLDLDLVRSYLVACKEEMV
ncbi:MAG: hypothetical protein V1837_01835 [Candidatus Woesearchaeota archaeon]